MLRSTMEAVIGHPYVEESGGPFHTSGSDDHCDRSF